nr:uncharacterized protein LOC123757364 [Procambarus clarkii]
MQLERGRGVVVVCCVWLCGVVLCGQPRVTLVESRWGNFFMVENTTLPAAAAFAILPANSICSCKTLCIASGRCQAWSLVETAGGGECRIAAGGPTTHNTTVNTTGTYFFRQESVNGTYVWRDDQLLYLLMPGLMLYPQAKELCSSIPGHRLLIVKSAQQASVLRYLWSLYSYPWATDLTKTAAGPVWGDGTPYNTTELSHTIKMTTNDYDTVHQHYAVYDSYLDDWYDDALVNVACQTNPRGVDW